MKTGRPLTLKSPQELLDLYVEYKKVTEATRWEKEEAVKSGRDAGKVVTLQLKIPLTIEGFKVHCYNNGVTNIHEYLYNVQERYTQFSTIAMRIREEIRQHQLTGGMIGLYNANLTARLNNLGDKKIHEGGDADKPIVITGMKII